MSVLLPPPPMKPFAAVFSNDQKRLDEALEAVSQWFGGCPDVLSPAFQVTETAFYRKEMGENLVKVYASWKKLIDPAELVELKMLAITWELDNSVDGQRVVNIDPGYISVGGLILSTGKFRGHRLYLGRGVWGELTLNYHQGAYQSFPWTYLDYMNPENQKWFLKMRKIYIQQLKEVNNCQP